MSIQENSVETFRLSPQQRRLWALSLEDPATYRAQCAIWLRGDLVPGLLRQALQEVVDRHEALRTVLFRRRGVKVPFQGIAERAIPSLGERDLGDLAPESREPALAELLATELRQEIPLDAPCPLRALLVRLEPDRHALVLTLPALHADAPTLGLLARELRDGYAARSAGEPVGPGEPAEEPVQYVQFAEWQNDLLDEGGEEGRAYWGEVAASAGPPLRLPNELAGSREERFAPRLLGCALTAAETSGLDALAARAGVAAPTVLLACWQALLARLGGQSDFGLRIVLDNREQEDLRCVLGLVARTVPLRCRLEAGDSLLSTVERLRASLDEAAEWQALLAPEETGTAGGEPRDLPVGFSGGEWPDLAPAGGVSFALHSQSACLERCKLDLACTREGGGWRLGLRYDPRVLPEAEAHRLAGRFGRLLGQALAAPEAPLEELDFLGEAERRFLLAEFNAAAVAGPGSAVHQLFAAQAARTPEAVAVVCDGRSYTYRELDEQADLLARHLGALGVSTETLVGISVQRSPLLLVAVLGVLKAGGAYLPLDPGYPAEWLRGVIAEAGPRLVLTESHLASRLPPELQQVLLDGELPAAPPGAASPPGALPAPAGLAYVLYTSGSTGRPKGVMIPHGGLSNYLAWCAAAYAVEEGAGAPVHSPLGFDLTVTSLFSPLLAGRTVFLLPEGRGAETLGDELRERGGFSLVKLTPAHLEVLARTLPPETAAASTAALVIGGEALFWENLAFWRRHAPRTRLINEYGPTETVVGCLVYEAAPEGEGPEAGPVPIGRPIANARAYVLDPAGVLVAFGMTGELYVGGAGVARGYLGRPDLTAERFLPDPLGIEPGGRLYRTGDLVRFSAGQDLVFLGRADGQVKVRGFRIEPAEIEAALLRFPGVAAAAVVARESAPGDRELVAYVAPAEAAGAAELRAHLASLLPEHMIPASFVMLPELPLTRHGKVDRRRLPAPGGAAAARHVPAQSPLEGRLVAIWEESLHRRGIGVTDSFFDLGGDSIRAVRLVSRINDELGANLEVADVFAHQSITSLAPVLLASAARTSIAAERAAGLAQIAGLQTAILADPGQRALLGEPEDFLPLSGIERGMVYYSLLLPDEPVYHDQFAYLLEIADLERFYRAFDLLVERHAILRSRFHLYTFQEPLKIVLRTVAPEREVQDLSGLPREERLRRIDAHREADLLRKFSFDGEPLWRLRLFRLEGDLFAVVWSWHHAILDGWSNHSFWIELGELYDAADLERRAPLPPLASSYKDYLALTLGRRASAATEAFWRELLAGAGRNRLPFNRTRSRERAERGMRTLERPAGEELLAGLRARALENHVSIQSLCLAAHVLLLRIVSGETDVVTGLVSHDRPAIEDGDRILGCFLNTVPVRLDTARVGSGRELVQAVHELRGGERAHEIPLVDIAAILGSRDTGDNPIFDTLFNFMDFHVVTEVGTGPLFRPMTSEALRRDYAFAPHEMTNTLFDVEVSTTLGNLLLRIKYTPRLFERSEIESALGLYQRLLAALVRDLDAPLDSLDLLTAEELQEVVYRFNDTAADFSWDQTLDRAFAEQAARTPGLPAVIAAGRSLTYGELDRQANRIAHLLRAEGVRPGDDVGVIFARSADLIAALLGVLKAGAAYVPIEPGYPAARKGYILKSKVALVLADRLYEIAPAESARVLVLPEAAALAAYPGSPPTVEADPARLAYTIYTSGSTGLPKGVMVEHRSVLNVCEWVNRQFGVGPGSRLLMLSSVCFDLSVYDIFGGLTAGAAVVIAEQEDLQDPERLLRLVSEERITFWNTVPSTLGLLVGHLESWHPGFRQRDLAAVFLSGDWIPLSLPARVRRFFPAARIVSLGGATEATMWSNWFPVGEVSPEWASIPYGRPLANSAFYILDERLRPVPPGVVGGLFIGGAGVARGYAAQPERTAFSFVPDPFSGQRGARLYRTGDLGRMLPDGNMEFLGRADHQVKIRGFRVELGEVESQLQKHERVREAVVIARVDRAGERFLAAYVVPAAEVSSAELRRHLGATLPEYMIPTVFVSLPALPLTPNGKLDRGALPAAGAEGHGGSGYTAPAGELETALVEVWEEVLGVSGIGTRHEFFALGGHSLSAIQVVSRVRRRFGCELSLRQFFEAGTVAGLAEAIGRVAGAPAETPVPALAEPIPREGDAAPAALSFAQERLWFLQQLDPESPAFNLGGAARLAGRLDAAALEAALAELVRRHEILRTSFAETGGVLLQRVSPAAREPLPRIDLSALARPAGERELARLGEGDLYRPFDLARGRLLRVRLVRLAEREHAVLFTLHHIVGDGWSLGLLVRELGELYAAAAEGRPSPLPELPIQYADYSRWQRRSLEGERLAGQLAYWRRRLAGARSDLSLPGRSAWPEVPRFRGAAESVMVPRPLAGALGDLAREEGATLFIVLLAAFTALLRSYSGQDDLVVGTNVANRGRPEIEPLIGFFVNNLALRSDLSGNPTFRQLLRRTRDVCLEAYAHQEVPFERVIEELRPERRGSYSPLFQVMFVLQRFPPPPRTFAGVELTPLELPSRVANFDLTLMLTEGEELSGALLYDRDLFAADAIELMAGQFLHLLESVAAHPDRSLDTLEVAAGSELYDLAGAFREDL